MTLLDEVKETSKILQQQINNLGKEQSQKGKEDKLRIKEGDLVQLSIRFGLVCGVVVSRSSDWLEEDVEYLVFLPNDFRGVGWRTVSGEPIEYSPDLKDALGTFVIVNRCDLHNVFSLKMG